MTTYNYAPEFYDLFDVFDRTFDTKGINHTVKTPDVPRYPLTDISYDDNKVAYIDIAVAGWSKDELSVQVEDNAIVVKGHKEQTKDDKKREYKQRLISTGDFKRTLYLNNTYTGGEIDVKLKDGILSITVQPAPEKKPSALEIKTE